MFLFCSYLRVVKKDRFIKSESYNFNMKSFEELSRQENIVYCVSGHFFDSGMAFEERSNSTREGICVKSQM